MVNITCTTTNGDVLVQFIGSSMMVTVNQQYLTDSTLTPVSTSSESTTTLTTMATPAPPACDSVPDLLAQPLKLVLGAIVCLPNVGVFTLNKINIGQFLGSNGQPVVVSGTFQSNSGASVTVVCRVAGGLVQQLLPLAQTFDASMIDINALRNALNITCSDNTNQHVVSITGNGVTGIDAGLLQQLFTFLNTKINAYGQVYNLLNDVLQIAGFTVKGGKLVTPWGSFDAGDAIDFLNNVAIVRKNGIIISLSTSLGTVVVSSDGSLTYTAKDGSTKTLTSGCTNFSAVGGTLSAVCKGQPFSFSPGGLISAAGHLSLPSGVAQYAIGAFRVPLACAADALCLSNVLAVAQNYLAAHGCMLGQDNSKAGSGDANNASDSPLFEISCNTHDSMQQMMILHQCITAVNANVLSTTNSEAESAIVPAAAMMPSTSTRASLASLLMLIAAVGAFTL